MYVSLRTQPVLIRALLVIWRLGCQKLQLDQPFPEPEFIEIKDSKEGPFNISCSGLLDESGTDVMSCTVLAGKIDCHSSVPFVIDIEFRDTMGLILSVRKLEGTIKGQMPDEDPNAQGPEFNIDVLMDMQ